MSMYDLFNWISAHPVVWGIITACIIGCAGLVLSTILVSGKNKRH